MLAFYQAKEASAAKKEASEARAEARAAKLQFDKNQRKLDKNQERLDYSQLILNEGQKPLPLNDDPKWTLFFTKIKSGSGLLEAANEARELPNNTAET